LGDGRRSGRRRERLGVSEADDSRVRGCFRRFGAREVRDRRLSNAAVRAPSAPMAVDRSVYSDREAYTIRRRLRRPA
jgi:hypothetical protein